MPSLPPTKPPSWLQAILVAIVAWAGIMALFGRTSWSDWTAPVWLEGDPLEIYARVKIAAEQPAHALVGFNRIERLGAPVSADWSGYPVPDRPVFVLTGLLSRVTGLIGAIHLTGALIAALNAASFFLAARWLRWRWEWAGALAIAFAFGTYNIRWGITLSFNQVFVLPPLVLLCARAVRPGPTLPQSRRSWLILACLLGGWLGLANPYLTYFAGIVAGGTLLLSLALRCPRFRWMPLAAFCGVMIGTFLLANAGAIAAHLRQSVIQNRSHAAADLEVFALRPLDWIIPPADHRIPALAQVGQNYHAGRQGQGEFFYNYLGFAGLAGVAILLIRSARSIRRRQWRRLGGLTGLTWITLFGIAGGLNTWIGAAGLDVFRAGNRIGIYALLWALLAGGAWVSRRSLAWPRAVSVSLALLIALGAAWEQTPSLIDRTASARHAERWQAATNVTDWLERELPGPALVFQLPVVPFPEAGPVGTMTDYEHALPFLTSRSLRFSYGQLHHSPWLRWARHVARQPAREFIHALERTGYAVIWLDRRAYPDGGDALARSLAAHQVIELSPPHPLPTARLFRLNPSPAPDLPDLQDPRLNDPWDSSPGPSPTLFAVSGWFPEEKAGDKHWRWATRQAAVGVWHDGPATSARVRFRLGGPPASRVVVRLDGEERWSGAPLADPQEFTVPLSPGLTLLQWELLGATFRPGGGDPRELGFMIENLSLSVP